MNRGLLVERARKRLKENGNDRVELVNDERIAFRVRKNINGDTRNVDYYVPELFHLCDNLTRYTDICLKDLIADTFKVSEIYMNKGFTSDNEHIWMIGNRPIKKIRLFGRVMSFDIFERTNDAGDRISDEYVLKIEDGSMDKDIDKFSILFTEQCWMVNEVRTVSIGDIVEVRGILVKSGFFKGEMICLRKEEDWINWMQNVLDARIDLNHWSIGRIEDDSGYRESFHVEPLNPVVDLELPQMRIRSASSDTVTSDCIDYIRDKNDYLKLQIEGTSILESAIITAFVMIEEQCPVITYRDICRHDIINRTVNELVLGNFVQQCLPVNDNAAIEQCWTKLRFTETKEFVLKAQLVKLRQCGIIRFNREQHIDISPMQSLFGPVMALFTVNNAQTVSLHRVRRTISGKISHTAPTALVSPVKGAAIASDTAVSFVGALVSRGKISSCWEYCAGEEVWRFCEQ